LLLKPRALHGVAKVNYRHFRASFVSPVRVKQSPVCLSGQEAPWPLAGQAAKPPALQVVVYLTYSRLIVYELFVIIIEKNGY